MQYAFPSYQSVLYKTNVFFFSHLLLIRRLKKCHSVLRTQVMRGCSRTFAAKAPLDDGCVTAL